MRGSDGGVSMLAGSNAYDIVHLVDKDLAIAGIASVGAPLNGLDNLLGHLVGNYHFEFGLLYILNCVFRNSIRGTDRLRATKTPNIRHGHARQTRNQLQGFHHLRNQKRLHDRFYFLHRTSLDLDLCTMRFKPPIQGRQHKQRQSGGSDESTDHHRRERLLNFSSRSSGNGHRQEAQAGDQRRHNHGSHFFQCATLCGFAYPQPLPTQLDDVVQENNTIHDRDPRDCNKPHAGRNTERHAAKGKSKNSATCRQWHVEKDQQCRLYRIEGGVEQNENQEHGQWNHDRQTLGGALEVFELPAPLNPICRWKFYFARDRLLRLGDKTSQISASDIGLDTDSTVDVATADLCRPRFGVDVSQLAERNQPALWICDLDILDLFNVATVVGLEPDLEGKPLLSFKHFAHLFATDCLNGIQHVASIDT